MSIPPFNRANAFISVTLSYTTYHYTVWRSVGYEETWYSLCMYHLMSGDVNIDPARLFKMNRQNPGDKESRLYNTMKVEPRSNTYLREVTTRRLLLRSKHQKFHLNTRCWDLAETTQTDWSGNLPLLSIFLLKSTRSIAWNGARMEAGSKTHGEFYK